MTTYALDEAEQALDDLRHGRFSGAAVLAVDPHEVTGKAA